MSDDDFFGKAMQGVRRIETEPRHVKVSPAAHAQPPSRSAPGKAAADAAPAHRPQRSDEPWILKADGISAERLRQLAAGRPPIDAETDLHGMTREEMYRALSDGMAQALDSGWRVLCLVHGRGLHSKHGRPVLKQAVYDWLREGPYAGRVLAAMPRPGTGGGSALVLLRRRR